MGTGSKNIKALLEHIDSDELVLPEIQRDFVWNKNNVLLLFDSLYRKLPIGYMLAWKAKTTVARKKFKGRLKKYGQHIDNFYGYLLDGQQRLTAIKLVRDGDDNYPLMFALWPEDEDNPENDRFSFKARWNNSPWYVPVSDILLDQITPYKLVERLKDVEDFDPNRDADIIYSSITKLKNILDYSVGMIEFEDTDYRKATELFIRFNSTGRKLNRNDLIAAELALTVPSLVSEKINMATLAYRPYFIFTKTFLIQCLAAVHTGKIDLKNPSEVWDPANEKKIKESWKRTEKGLGRTIDLLTGTVKWDSDNWLPSINSIIPLIYLLSFDKFSQSDRRLARKWLLQANIYAIFSGSTYSELDRIIRGLKKQTDLEKLINLTRKDVGKIRPEHFELRRKSGATMSLFISMLRNDHAKDWINRTSLDGSVMGHNAELQVHHFFPRALLHNNGYKTELINTFANYTVINKETNLDISDSEPINYVKKLRIRKKDLHVQCIPSDRSLWTLDKYEDFIDERRKLLAKRANSFLNS